MKNVESILMIDWPSAVVSDKQTVAAEVGRCSSVEIAMSGSSATDDARCSGLRRKPHDSTFPIVTMSQARRWRVLRHIPSVHDSESAIVRPTASVDLAGAAAATVRRTTRRVETGAGRVRQLDIPG